MLQYYVKDFFSPIIVTGQLNVGENQKTKLDIFVVSDIENISEAEVRVKVGKWSALGFVNETSFPATVVSKTKFYIKNSYQS